MLSLFLFLRPPPHLALIETWIIYMKHSFFKFVGIMIVISAYCLVFPCVYLLPVHIQQHAREVEEQLDGPCTLEYTG